MPNWNTTDYTLYGNKDNIKRLYTDLKNTVDIDRTKESKPFTFLGNSYWLGYIKNTFCQRLKKNCQPEEKFLT